MPKIKLRINNKTYTVEAGQTVLNVAKEKGIEIPSLCYHPDFCAKGNCRVCVVEVVGRKKLTTACTTLAEEGIEVLTESEKVQKIRKVNLELIFAEHIEKCADCVWRFECKLLHYSKEYKILLTALKDRKGKRKTYKFANAVELDASQCIDCRNCIEACSGLQKIHYLELTGKGMHQTVEPVKKKDIHCILCGQCAVHCPVSSAQEQTQFKQVEAVIKDEAKIVIAQFAPPVRVSLSEDFGLPSGAFSNEQIAAGLKDLGFDFVFDSGFSGAIFTEQETGEILRHRATKTGPLFSSSCPAWVKFVEDYHPEILPRLARTNSPHILGGRYLKTIWAEKQKIDPKNIVVVSIMPCTAKKHEAVRSEFKIGDYFPVDYVLTTREISFLLKKKKFDFSKTLKTKLDDPFFGQTQNKKSTVDSKSVGKGRVLSVVGISKVKEVLKNFLGYDYIEVWACPEGCIGGGGQPIPTTREICGKRREASSKK